MKNNKGQTTVEYIMLLGVILALSIGILRSDIFIEFFGEEGQVFTTLKNSWEHSYRHGYPGVLPTVWDDGTRINRVVHQSYFFNGTTRFFFPKIYDGRP